MVRLCVIPLIEYFSAGYNYTYLRMEIVRGVWLIIMILGGHPLFCCASMDLRTPSDSGCWEKIKNYHCYCPRAKRPLPTGNNKCDSMFDAELLDTTSGFPDPIVLNWPELTPELEPIEMKASSICVFDKYCKLKITPKGHNWVVIDWCLTTKAPNFYHLQLMGPPHSPVCCEPNDDKKYTMMCMRRDMSRQRMLSGPLHIHVYIKLLPRAPIEMRLSLILFKKTDDGAGSGQIAKNKLPIDSKDSVKLVRVEGLMLDLTSIKKWEDLLKG